MKTPASHNESILLVVGLVALLALSSFIPASWLGGEKKVQYPLLSFEDSLMGNDTDGNGVTTWQEFISESLGTPETTVPVETDPRTLASLNDPNNLTSSFTKNLYITSVALKENGIDDQAASQETINQLLAKEAQKLSTISYTRADIHIAKDDSVQALKTYGNSVGALLKDFITQKSISDDLTSLGNFTQSQNETDLVPLVQNAQHIQVIVNKLVALQVPPQAVDAHVEILNRIGQYSQVLTNLSLAYDDPVRATFVLDQYPGSAVAALQSIPYLGKFFNDKAVLFSSKEGGYLFTVGYTAN